MKGNRKTGIFFMALLVTNLLLGSCGSSSSSTSTGTSSSINSNKSTSSLMNSNIDNYPEGISKFDDGYKLAANWIWANVDVKQGQWVSLRKTFNLDEVPSQFMARISADTKYWMWINGELAIFEGQLKLGNSIDTWFYDKEDLSKYLVKGENTIAVQVFYSGKTSSSTINTGVPAFLFDAKAGDIRVASDTSWKATIDPAYKEPISLNNNRNGEANIKYSAPDIMQDENGNMWTDKDYDDSSWPNAVNQDDKILVNRIYNDYGKISDVYYKDIDPRLNLILRSIPQVKLDEIGKFTEDGSNGTGKWTRTQSEYSFAPLSLPNTYTLEAEVMVAEPIDYTSNQPVGGAIGFCVCVSDSSNFYMPQISFRQATLFDGVRFSPHIKRNGAWNVTTQDLTNTEIGKSLYEKGSYDYRYNTKHIVRIEVNPKTITTYLNNNLLGTINDTSLQRSGNTIGIRQDINEMINLYSLRVTDRNGNELYDANIDSLNEGSDIEGISLLAAENGNFSSYYKTVKKDGNDKSYVEIRNSCAALSNQMPYSQYQIVNETNIQGTPYLKVKSKVGGELISIKSDSWVNGSSTSIAHQYITRAGTQSWEALGWMNGYVITFTIPDSVEVLELGFRKSGYDTVATGSVVTDNEVLNQLYNEAYDTLYVCMRDSYMDCPDRERAQWLGDAVINMQQAAYAMDENAALLYKKTLTQALGFVKRDGAIPSMIALGNDNLELPMQTLAGVHSFWQYYMYYGDVELMHEAFPILIDYLKLFKISEKGVIVHRTGTWDWFDWGDHPDTVVMENCWYYIALESVLKIAELEGSVATLDEINFLKDRMNLIKSNFDELYWDYDKNAYYRYTDNGKADDRANALAIYSGLANRNRYNDILNVLTSSYNASPYMEKYVLEAMYMMGADVEAMERTLKRFSPFTNDNYPTLPEIWADKTLFGGDETKNHAWTGAPLSMLYMYNAGITPLSPAFKTIQIKPQLGTLNNISATVERESGKIQVDVNRTDDKYTLDVKLPSGFLGGVIYVPYVQGTNKNITINGNVVYANGTSVNNMPEGISYKETSGNFVAFNVPSGTYTITSQ